MAHIIIHCYYKGEKGAVKGFFDEMAKEIQQDIRAEDGCIMYDYYLSAEDPTKGVLIEEWRDAEALAEHRKGVPMSRLIPIKGQFGLETRVVPFELKD